MTTINQSPRCQYDDDNIKPILYKVWEIAFQSIFALKVGKKLIFGKYIANFTRVSVQNSIGVQNSFILVTTVQQFRGKTITRQYRLYCISARQCKNSARQCNNSAGQCKNYARQCKNFAWQCKHSARHCNYQPAKNKFQERLELIDNNIQY